jgi:hypothetical protein
MWALWRGTKYTIRGKVVASPKSRPWWILWIRVCPWLVLAPKVLQLCTNQFCLILCRSIWVIKCLSFFLVPSQNSSMPLNPPKCCKLRSVSLTPYYSIVFTSNSHLNLSRSLGPRHIGTFTCCYYLKVFCYCLLGVSLLFRGALLLFVII